MFLELVETDRRAIYLYGVPFTHSSRAGIMRVSSCKLCVSHEGPFSVPFPAPSFSFQRGQTSLAPFCALTCIRRMLVFSSEWPDRSLFYSSSWRTNADGRCKTRGRTRSGFTAVRSYFRAENAFHHVYNRLLSIILTRQRFNRHVSADFIFAVVVFDVIRVQGEASDMSEMIQR